MWRTHDVVFTDSSVSRPAAPFCRPLLLLPAARVSRRVHGLAHASLTQDALNVVHQAWKRKPRKHGDSCSNDSTRRYGGEMTDTEQEKYLIIYLNSLVLYLCLYIVNSATLQRITLSVCLKRFEMLS